MKHWVMMPVSVNIYNQSYKFIERIMGQNYLTIEEIMFIFISVFLLLIYLENEILLFKISKLIEDINLKIYSIDQNISFISNTFLQLY